jgi:hypothetical protein
MSLVLETEPGNESAKKGQKGGNATSWQPHFRLADAMIAPSIEIGDAVG